MSVLDDVDGGFQIRQKDGSLRRDPGRNPGYQARRDDVFGLVGMQREDEVAGNKRDVRTGFDDPSHAGVAVLDRKAVATAQGRKVQLQRRIDLAVENLQLGSLADRGSERSHPNLTRTWIRHRLLA